MKIEKKWFYDKTESFLNKEEIKDKFDVGDFNKDTFIRNTDLVSAKEIINVNIGSDIKDQLEEEIEERHMEILMEENQRAIEIAQVRVDAILSNMPVWRPNETFSRVEDILK